MLPSPMLIRIQATDSRPIYLQIMDEVRRAIVLELTSADEPLPSVRQLAGDLRVNPNTVQQAYRELEREGVVYTRRGRGTFVAVAEANDGEARNRLALQVAEHSLRQAYRNGLSAKELIEAIRSQSKATEAAESNGGEE